MSVLGGIPFTETGALPIQIRPASGVPSTEPVNGGWAIASSLNAAYFEDAGAAVPATAVTNGGVAFTPDGAIYLTQSSSGTFASVGGHKVRNDGALLVKGGTPTVATDPYIGGWAHDGATLAAYVDNSFILPLRDLGAGAVDTTLFLGTGSPTFTRATAAAAKLSTGLWKLDVASGTARSHYLGNDTAVGAYGGFLREGQRTNSCLQARDITNASWTKTTLTTAKTSTGIDGVTNSCTRCTATGADSLALQAITLASAAKTFSVWMKRITGTGNIFITLDNDATRTDVTALINSSTFTRVSMTQTLANPTAGFKIATSGDAIDVDVAQLEDTFATASSPIPTTTLAVTRNEDVLTFPNAGNLLGTQGACYLEASYANLSGFLDADSAGNRPLLFSSGGPLQIFDGTGGAGTLATPAASSAIRKFASSWGGTTMNVFIDGGAGTPGAFDGDINVGTNMKVGARTGAADQITTIKNLRIWTRKPSDAALQAATT